MTESPPDTATANTTSGTNAAAAAVEPPPPPPPPPPPTPVVLLQPSQRKNASRRPAKLFRTVRSAFRSFPSSPPRPRAASPPPPTSSSTTITTTTTTAAATTATSTAPPAPPAPSSATARLASPSPSRIRRGACRGCWWSWGRRRRSSSKRWGRRGCCGWRWTGVVGDDQRAERGYAARREATESDVRVMQLLHAVSMGAGVLPADMTDPADGELTYMRAYFDRVVGSRDSETFYMLNPDGNNGPELTIFFVRI
uniref:Protein MIZU-KUSSEI 1 n=1 Tax=Ananas comosus var. bracteatus TaxID=296719 RepID=A0A6V7QA28_ANACO|nr:unnamed protein product [Ananas comosus var. bracteatus]